jgi:ATP-dependent helicase/nuclease subunit A
VRDFGPEAHDVLDVFLGLAYDHDQRHIPDLSLFLESCETWKNRPIKRDLDLDIGVRVMTVHGAKGLEASHVIIVDDGEPPHELRRGSFLVPVTLSVGTHEVIVPFWAAGCGSLSAIEEARARLHGEAFCDHMRLLYVALTRARDHLVFAPFCKRRSSSPCPEDHVGRGGAHSWPHPSSWTAAVNNGLGF